MIPIYQISVFLENQTGCLADVTGILAAEGIDMRAINIAATSDYGVLRMITINSQHTIDVLSEHGFTATRTPILVTGIPDVPGGMNRVVQIFKEENIGIQYVYAVFGQFNGRAFLAFRVDEIDRAREALKDKGIYIAECKDIGINL